MGFVRYGLAGAVAAISLVACGPDQVGGYGGVGGSSGSGGASAGSSGKGQGGSSSGGRGGSSSGTSGKGGTMGGAGVGGLAGDGGMQSGGAGGTSSAGTGGAQGGNGGSAAGNAGTSGASGEPFQSCNGDVGAGTDCGPSANEDCCASLTVPAGSFLRSYDGVENVDDAYPARLSSFRLDRFEVTIGRFRNFVDAWVGGWRPSPGAGKHTHLTGGGIAGETGWDETWSSMPPSTLGQWNTDLVCDEARAVWTPTSGPNDKKPITCVAWAEAYAFCIYDGGFLPTEAEWNYAAAGGEEQRYYPWSSPAASTEVDPTYAVYDCLADGLAGCAPEDVPFVGSRSPKGDGRWGHADIAGSAFESNLDWWVEPYAISLCIDCADVAATDGNRIYRGGAFVSPSYLLNTAIRSYGGAFGRGYAMGIRCARPD